MTTSLCEINDTLLHSQLLSKKSEQRLPLAPCSCSLAWWQPTMYTTRPKKPSKYISIGQTRARRQNDDEWTTDERGPFYLEIQLSITYYVLAGRHVCSIWPTASQNEVIHFKSGKPSLYFTKPRVECLIISKWIIQLLSMQISTIMHRRFYVCLSSFNL